MDPQTRIHRELIGLLRQHSAFCDQRHLVLVGWMVAGLLLSQTVCFDRWNTVLPLGHCLAASWQVICQGQAVPLLWKTLDHPSASVSAKVVIELLERADQLLSLASPVLV